MKKISKAKILKFLNEKGIEHKLEMGRIILKHCPVDYHRNKWCVKIWFSGAQNDWCFMCDGSPSHRNQSFPFTEFIRLCEKNIDKIRNKEIKIHGNQS